MTTRGLQLLLLHHLEKGVTNTENHTNQIGSGIGLFIQADCLCLPPPFYQVGYPPLTPHLSYPVKAVSIWPFASVGKII